MTSAASTFTFKKYIKAESPVSFFFVFNQLLNGILFHQKRYTNTNQYLRQFTLPHSWKQQNTGKVFCITYCVLPAVFLIHRAKPMLRDGCPGGRAHSDLIHRFFPGGSDGISALNQYCYHIFPRLSPSGTRAARNTEGNFSC